jgi:hypothetical protein
MQVIRNNLSSSLRHFFVSYAILSIAAALILSRYILPSVIDALNQNMSAVHDQLPDEAILTIDNDRIVTQNIDLPFTLPAKDAAFDNLIIIDPDSIAQDINRKSTYLLITPRAFSFSSPINNSQPTILPASQFEQPTTITATDAKTYIQNLQNLLATLNRQLFLITLLSLFVGLTVSRLLYVALFAFIFQAFGFFLNRRYLYTDVFKIALHTIIIAEVINLLNRLISPAMPSLFIVAFAGLSLIALYALPKTTK